MAEISVTLSVHDTTKTVTSKVLNSFTWTSGDGEQKGTVSTSTVEASITIDAQITGGNGPGLCILKNLSSTAAEIIDIGTETADLDLSIDAGAACLLFLKSTETTIYHDAQSGTPQLYFEIYERGS